MKKITTQSIKNTLAQDLPAQYKNLQDEIERAMGRSYNWNSKSRKALDSLEEGQSLSDLGVNTHELEADLLDVIRNFQNRNSRGVIVSNKELKKMDRMLRVLADHSFSSPRKFIRELNGFITEYDRHVKDFKKNGLTRGQDLKYLLSPLFDVMGIMNRVEIDGNPILED